MLHSFSRDSLYASSWQPSPNFGERLLPINALVLHYTGMDSGQASLDWLCDERSSVSCHYLIFEDGRIVQMVAEAKRAWHAGKSFWAGESDLNSCSIGIEIVNPGHLVWPLKPYPQAQIDALIRLCRDILHRRQIKPQRVLAHSDIAPTRKTDPGEHFPWKKLFEAGIGLWVKAAPVSTSPASEHAVQRCLVDYGYDAPLDDKERLNAAILAFQRRFRPQKLDGLPDESTLMTAWQLLSLERDDIKWNHLMSESPS